MQYPYPEQQGHQIISDVKRFMFDADLILCLA